jgi:hypothetical protein
VAERRAFDRSKYKSGLLCHSCSMFRITSAQSNSTLPLGKRIGSEKNEEWALDICMGWTFQFKERNSMPW